MRRVALLTVSDRASRGEQEDLSGPVLARMLQARGWDVVEAAVVPDEVDKIAPVLKQWADAGEVNLILTTGGTGLSPRDVTPEATQLVCERMAPGLAEAMRRASMSATPHAMLSRAMAGIRGQTLIVNLPGSPRGAKENLEAIVHVLPHAMALLAGDPEAEAGHEGPEAHGHL